MDISEILSLFVNRFQESSGKKNNMLEQLSVAE